MRNRPYGFEIYLVNVKTIRTIAQIFVAFSEKLNFNYYQSVGSNLLFPCLSSTLFTHNISLLLQSLPRTLFLKTNSNFVCTANDYESKSRTGQIAADRKWKKFILRFGPQIAAKSKGQ